jgi:hypothetical protein
MVNSISQATTVSETEEQETASFETADQDPSVTAERPLKKVCKDSLLIPFKYLANLFVIVLTLKARLASPANKVCNEVRNEE